MAALHEMHRSSRGRLRAVVTTAAGGGVASTRTTVLMTAADAKAAMARAGSVAEGYRPPDWQEETEQAHEAPGPRVRASFPGWGGGDPNKGHPSDAMAASGPLWPPEGPFAGPASSLM